MTDLTDAAGRGNKFLNKAHKRSGALLLMEFDLRGLNPGSIPHSAGI